jgi:hypothetical protein
MTAAFIDNRFIAVLRLPLEFIDSQKILKATLQQVKFFE